MLSPAALASTLLLTLLIGCTEPFPVEMGTEGHSIRDTGTPEAEPTAEDEDQAVEDTGEPAPPPEDTGTAQEDDEPSQDEPAEEPSAEGTLRMVMIDVGQGDASLLVGPDGTSLLVDGGKSSSGDEIERVLEQHGVERLDYTIVSHLHADHLGAMDEVLAAHPEVRSCYDSGGSASTDSYADYAAEAAGCRGTLKAGDQLDLGPGVQATVLHPSASDSDENANSIVLRVSFAGVTILLGGDCPEDDCEEELNPGAVDIYKVHHHGSASSSSAAFLDRIRPELALISVGNNSYGHPTSEALGRLDAVGATVMRTDQHSDITVSVDAGGWWVD